MEFYLCQQLMAFISSQTGSMGVRILELKMPAAYSEMELAFQIEKKLQVKEFTFQVENKSLDARKKNDIHWLLKVSIHVPGILPHECESPVSFEIPFKRRNKKVVITGSGPAGFFAAFVLQQAGFDTMILERGSNVNKREAGILHFEKTGKFDPISNYSFGEGGAGTFSDGKLTSRSKHISAEREFVISSYIDAGAPAEIRYMAHPHIGSDNLRQVVRSLRNKYLELGGDIRFETTLFNLVKDKGLIKNVITDEDEFHGDYFIIAPGHSAYETYRMLIREGVIFRTKNFALGCRAEHLQSDINRAQWGVEKLEGVKAAEYRLTSTADGKHPVYSFCMCPGGTVVPAASYARQNIVNGMSNYRRDGRFANAACVAGIHPDQMAGKKISPEDALSWLEALEQSFFDFSGGYKAPFCNIRDFLKGKESTCIPETSYPLGLKPAPLWTMLPEQIVLPMREGLKTFDRKIKGYENGILLGLESKTSSPIQVLREKTGVCVGFSNLFIVGEGSGYAGGIISSAADGIKVARQIIIKEN